MFVGVFGDFLDDLAIAVRRRDGALDGGSVKCAFVFHIVERFLAGVRVDLADCFAFFEKDAVHSHVRLDGDRLVIHQKAVENCLLDAVAKNWLAKKRDGVRGGCGGEADLDGVEVIEGVAPDAHLLRGVTAMTFVGDDQVESVDRNVESSASSSISVSPPTCAKQPSAPKRFRAMRWMVET